MLQRILHLHRIYLCHFISLKKTVSFGYFLKFLHGHFWVRNVRPNHSKGQITHKAENQNAKMIRETDFLVF
jgi:hypothetical protein